MKQITLITRKLKEDEKDFVLEYELISDSFPLEEGGGEYYGVIVRQFLLTGEDRQLYDSCQLLGFSESMEETEEFFYMLIDGEAMPVSLYELADDWKSAFCTHYHFAV